MTGGAEVEYVAGYLLARREHRRPGTARRTTSGRQSMFEASIGAIKPESLTRRTL